MSSPAIKRKITSPRSICKNLLSPALKTPKIDNGVFSQNTIISEMRLMESRLQSHTEKLVGDLAHRLEIIESTLLNKIQSELNLFHERANEIEDRLASVESEMCVIDILRKEITEIKNNLNNNTTKANQRPDISTDAIIFGIPFEDSENLKSIFNQISHAIDFLPPQIRDIFRIKPKASQDKSTAVIIKFYTPFDRNRVLKAFSDYRRRIKNTINLCTLGFSWNSTFKIFESLDVESRNLLQLAHRYRRDGKIHNVFSSRGRVFIRPNKNSDSIHINCDGDLGPYITTQK